MARTWKPITAGILSIISGAIGTFSVIGFITAITATNMGTFIPDVISPGDLPFASSLITTVLIIFLILSVIEAVFPILGGIFALQRKEWGWALAGSIIAIVGVFPLGVLATIFVSMAKGEFEQTSPEVVPTD